MSLRAYAMISAYVRNDVKHLMAHDEKKDQRFFTETIGYRSQELTG